MAVIMVVIVPMVVRVDLAVVMMMAMTVRVRVVVLLAVGADPFDVMVMALLGQPDLGLESQDLRPVFAEGAVHLVLAVHDLLDPVGEGVQHQGMILEIGGFQELDLRMALGELVGDAVDALHQHAGEQEIGKDDDAPVAQLHRMLEAGPDQRECNAAVADLGPAEAHALPQHPRDLADIGIGIGVGGAAADDHQQGLLPRDPACGAGFGLLDALGSDGEQPSVHGEIAAIVDLEIATLGRIGVEHRGDVVLHMAGGEQHAGNRQDVPHATAIELVESVADDGTGEFEETRGDRILRQSCLDAGGHRLEFGDRFQVAAAMAADHHPDLAHSASRFPWSFVSPRTRIDVKRSQSPLCRRCRARPRFFCWPLPPMP